MFMVKYRMGKNGLKKKRVVYVIYGFKKTWRMVVVIFVFFPIFCFSKKLFFWRKKSYKQVIQSYNYVVRSKSISAQETIVDVRFYLARLGYQLWRLRACKVLIDRRTQRHGESSAEMTVKDLIIPFRLDCSESRKSCWRT